MNRFTRQQDLVLQRMDRAPAHPVLIQLLSMAQKNVGKTITISWPATPGVEVYILETLIGDDTREFVGRRTGADSKEPRWTLSREPEEKKSPEDKRTEIWSHVTGDVGLVLNLIWSETTGTNQETAESMLMTTHAAKLGHRLERPMNANYTAPSTPIEDAALRSPIAQAPIVPQNVTLAGELAEIDLSGIFQSIMICKMTGRLDIQDRLSHAEIYFDDGVVGHAIVENVLAESTRRILGDQALLSVLTWDTGSFTFQKDRRTSERSVKRRLEGLLLEGASLRDYHKYLRNLKVSEDSVLFRRDSALSDEQLNEKLVDGLPIDAAVQKKFYQAIDGKQTLLEIVTALNIPKTLWTPIVFNLFSCELLSCDSLKTDDRKQKEDAPVIDQSLVLQASRSLVRPETGLFTFPLFVHFLELELARNQRAQTACSIVVFELKNNKDALTNAALQQVREILDSIKEKFDIIGHYKIFDFVVLLPLQTDEAARDFVHKLEEMLRSTKLDGLISAELKMTFGISSAPADGNQVAALLAAAEKAKQEAVTKGSICLTARDLRWEKHSEKASLAMQTQNFAEAEACWVSACNEAEYFKSSDPRLMHAVQQLVDLQMKQERYAMAETVLELLLNLKEQAHGANSLEVTMVRSELARCHYLQGHYDLAEPLLREDVAFYKQTFGSHHVSTANALYNLGTLCLVRDRAQEATAIFKTVKETLEFLLGPDHPDTRKVVARYESLVSSSGDADGDCFTTGSFRAFRATDGGLR